jgi:hypothetical protein
MAQSTLSIPAIPFYFQITSGFGTTVADGVTSAIQNAVTNVAMDITLRASDPRVQIINHTGTLTGIAAGQTAAFDIEFIGDGRPARFDLQFIRSGTSVVLGSIPVVLGTPIPGDGYNFDDLEDGEIHKSSHFGHVVANQAPLFLAGPPQSALEDAGLQIVPGWATAISAGTPTETLQTLQFTVTTTNPALFSVAPSVAADGTLSWQSAANVFGTAEVTVVLHDNGGTAGGGVDTSGTAVVPDYGAARQRRPHRRCRCPGPFRKTRRFPSPPRACLQTTATPTEIPSPLDSCPCPPTEHSFSTPMGHSSTPPSPDIMVRTASLTSLLTPFPNPCQ